MLLWEVGTQKELIVFFKVLQVNGWAGWAVRVWVFSYWQFGVSEDEVSGRNFGLRFRYVRLGGICLRRFLFLFRDLEVCLLRKDFMRASC